MGRPPQGQQAMKETTLRLIGAAEGLIISDGLENVTIRKIASEAGMSSAMLYRYFRDLDELLLFACIDLFRAYCSDLVTYTREHQTSSPEEIYRTTWQFFCRYAFRYPECINHLFFSRHSERLAHVIRTYYEYFPEQLEGITGNLQMMIRSADLYQRNLEVLRPMMDGAGEERIHLINDLTISYFYMLLNEKLRGGAEVDGQIQTDRMLDAIKFLTRPE